MAGSPEQVFHYHFLQVLVTTVRRAKDTKEP